MPRRNSLPLGALACVLALQGCTYLPHDGDALSSGDEARFIGFATAPSLEIQIQAKSPLGESWITIATATSAAQPFAISSPTFKQNMYQWSRTFWVPPGFFSGNQVTLRTRQRTSSTDFVEMFMYDSAGFTCLVNRFTAAGTGELDVWNAGIVCSDDRHEITLHR
jgi:hypothetical protein